MTPNSYHYTIVGLDMSGYFESLHAAREGLRRELEETMPPDATGEYEIFEMRAPKFSSMLDLEDELIRAYETGRAGDELEVQDPLTFPVGGMVRFVDATKAVLDTLFALCGGRVECRLIECAFKGRWGVEVVEVSQVNVGPVPYAESLDNPNVRTARLFDEHEVRLSPKLTEEQHRDDFEREGRPRADRKPGRRGPPRSVSIFAGDEIPSRVVEAALEAIDPRVSPRRSANLELDQLVTDPDPGSKH